MLLLLLNFFFFNKHTPALIIRLLTHYFKSKTAQEFEKLNCFSRQDLLIRQTISCFLSTEYCFFTVTFLCKTKEYSILLLIFLFVEKFINKTNYFIKSERILL